MDDDQQFCLRWNNHQSTLISVFDTLLENEKLVDCTLAAEGKFLKAHKVVLSACSPYFATLLQEQYDKHPIFILKDVKYQELRAMMDYMYRGEVNISQDQLAALLKAAESLQIKGLSDNRTGGSSGVTAPKPEQHHRGLNVPVAVGGKLTGGYTLEQTKRARIGPTSMDSQDMTASREGSSSPSRRRRKVRRRSIENIMTEIHDNSNSSQLQAANQALLQQQANASLANVAATVLATQIPVTAATTSTGQSGAAAVAATIAASSTQQLTTSVTKKTECVKGTSDAMNTENVQAGGVAATGADDQEMEHVKGEKHNHKQKSGAATAAAGGPKEATELVIEPKSEYEEEGNDETVEDLTLDDEDMGMDDLDQNAGTSQGGEGSSQGYAPWQHDRSQEEILLATQEAQQRDPQVKHDKSEQTDNTPEEFELDDCLLESNDIVITQNKDGFVLHVKKLGNITTAKIASGDEDQAAAAAVAAATGQAHITDVHDLPEVKPTLTTLTTSQAIKLPSSECELINIKKIITPTTTLATHHPHATATIIQPQQIYHPQHHELQQQHQQHHQQVQSIITTHGGHPQTINLMGLRNVQITEQKPIVSRIRKIVTPQGTTAANVQIMEPHEVHAHHHELTEGTKYEISEIDLNNPTASAAIISDLVKYAEIDDIELPDGTKIGIGFAPTDITEHMQTATTTTQLAAIEDDPQQQQQQQHHHHQQQHQMQHQQLQTEQHHHIQQEHHQHQQHPHHQQLQLQEHDDATTSVEATILPEGITLQEHPTITKSYTILTTRPMKQETTTADGTTTTTEYEISLSESSMGNPDDTESKYVCRHCGKKYRWKSTLRRHENVECGGKEPCHPCPHCSYKAKQRGNLGVHVRKHHPDKPQLESKRGRKA